MPEDAGDAPAVILLNTGIEYRVGSHRLYVPLARDLAARGHVVFRYDLGGIGDSAPPEGANENVAYPARALDDLREAVGLVRDRAPGRKVFLVGLCSGAWHAFRAAREALQVDGIVSINPPLYLTDRQSWTTRLSAQYQERRNYSRKLRDSSSWLNALSGRSEYAPRSIRRHLCDAQSRGPHTARRRQLGAARARRRPRGRECPRHHEPVRVQSR